jgi:hypothetical protein
MKLTAKHLELYKKVSERGEGRICNDLNPDEVELLTPGQWKEMAKAYHDWNGDPEEFLEYSNYVLPDFCVLSYLRFLILNEVKKQLPKKYHAVVEFEGRFVTEVEACNPEEATDIALVEYAILNNPKLNLSVKTLAVKEIKD